MISRRLRIASKRIFAGAALAAVAVFCLSFVQEAFAQDYTPLSTIPGITTQGVPENPVKKLANIYGISIGIAAVLAVVMIIWAGLEYATAEAITGKSDAKKRIIGVASGLGLLLGSYLLLRTINIDLVNVNLDLSNPRVGSTVRSNYLEDFLKNVQASAKAYEDASKGLEDAKAKTAALDTRIENEFKKLQSDPAYVALFNELGGVEADINDINGLMDDLRRQIEEEEDQESQAVEDMFTQYEAYLARRNQLEAQHERIMESIGDKNSALESLIAQRKAAVAVEKAQAITKIETSMDLQTGNAISAVRNGLAGNGANMVALSESTERVMENNFLLLKESGASPEKLTQARDQIEATKGIITTFIQAQNAIANAPVKTGISGYLDSEVVRQRDTLVKTAADQATAAAQKDPGNAQLYSNTAKNLEEGIDAAIAQKLGCGTKGILKTSVKITCVI